MKTHTHTYLRMNVYNNIIRAERCDNPNPHQWMNGKIKGIFLQWYVHTVGYYSAIKSKKVLTHVTRWMNSEIIVLSKRCH